MSAFQTPFWRRACRVLGARLFHWAENNGVADARCNGEAWLVRSLVARHRAKTRDAMTVIDAGANAGDYSELVLRAATAATCQVAIHAFEPSAAARTRLEKRFGTDVRLTVSVRPGASLTADKRGKVASYG